jgi:hypothetical protein
MLLLWIQVAKWGANIKGWEMMEMLVFTNQK